MVQSQQQLEPFAPGRANGQQDPCPAASVSEPPLGAVGITGSPLLKGFALNKLEIAVIAFAMAIWCLGIVLRILELETIRRLVFAEDQILQTGTTIVFFLAFLVVCLRTIRDRSLPFWLGLTGGLSLVMALEELDYFQRLIHWEPYMIWGVALDGFHDIPAIIKGGFAVDPFAASIALAGLLVATGTVVRIVRRRHSRTAPVKAGGTNLRRLAMAGVCITIAQIIDLHLSAVNALLPVEKSLEEVLEFCTAVLMLAFVFHHAPPASGHDADKLRGAIQ